MLIFLFIVLNSKPESSVYDTGPYFLKEFDKNNTGFDLGLNTPIMKFSTLSIPMNVLNTSIS